MKIGESIYVTCKEEGRKELVRDLFINPQNLFYYNFKDYNFLGYNFDLDILHENGYHPVTKIIGEVSQAFDYYYFLTDHFSVYLTLLIMFFLGGSGRQSIL